MRESLENITFDYQGSPMAIKQVNATVQAYEAATVPYQIGGMMLSTHGSMAMSGGLRPGKKVSSLSVASKNKAVSKLNETKYTIRSIEAQVKEMTEAATLKYQNI